MNQLHVYRGREVLRAFLKYWERLCGLSPSSGRNDKHITDFARPHTAVFLILLLLSSMFLQLKNVGFCNLYFLMVLCILKNNMLYFKKNGSELFTRISDQKKVFGSKQNSTIGKSRKKSIDIYVFCFFLRDSQSEYDYERIEQSAFYKKNASCAPAGSFLADAPIMLK